jgi:hypothetical protein
MPFTTPAMARGYVDISGVARIGLGSGPLAAMRRPSG